ncbi:MAG: hypothetical protein BGO25_13715 [Acidobacteriales bacterium 59-55]|nr:MAG: hypothetical protein BGO25_13715 [Acidobacteriales bacterium 59-55]
MTADTLAARIAQDEESYREVVRIERQIVERRSSPGFADACCRIRLVAEIQKLAETIRKNKILLLRVKK